jgi:hypothetical protein
VKLLVITGIFIAAVVGGVAHAGSGVKCPMDHLSDDVEGNLGAAPTCKAAVDLFWACGTGGSRDAARLQMVSEKCEPDYARAKPLRRAAEREISTCSRNAARDFGPEGSMYRSWAAYCAASVHDRYSVRNEGHLVAGLGGESGRLRGMRHDGCHVIGGREALERADSAVRVQSAHQSLISPLLPPLASRPSSSTAKEKTQLP